MKQAMELSEKKLDRTGSLCSPDPHSQLFIAFQDRDIDTFQNILKAGVKDSYIDPNHWYEDPHYGTLLDLACQTQNSSQYVKALLQAGADPNKINSVRKKAPLHFAVENKDLHSVDLLLNASCTNPNVLDNTGSTPLHYAAKLDNTEYLVQLLNNPKTNVNIANRKGQTAVHIAASQENKEAILLLIQADNIELDKIKTANGKSGRDVILENFQELESKLPGSNGRKENGVVTAGDLFSLLHRHEFESFLAAITLHKDLLDTNDGLHTFLQYTCEFGLLKEVEALLRLGADPNTTHPSNRTTPIMLACRKGYYNILRLLIRNDKTNYHPVDGETVLHAAIKGSLESSMSLGASKEDQNHFKCLELLLNNVPRNKLNINSGDIKGNTALHYAANQGDRDVILLLLRQGAYVGIRNTLGEPALADVNPRIMEMYLDECLTTNDKLPREDNYEIIFRYNFLAPPKVPPKLLNSSQVTLQLDANSTELELEGDVIITETDPLLYMCQSSELRPLLKHPVLTSFLHLKWHRIRRFFYFNLTFYVIFWALLTGYILGIYGAPNSSDELPKNSSRTERETLPFEMNEDNSFSEPLRMLVTVFLFVFIIRELFQLIISPMKYLISPENWLEISIISVTIAILFCNSCIKIRHQMSAIAILLSWAELVLLIGRHPSLSTNIEMLKTVSWNFLKFLAWYSILIVAFALSFYTLFRDAKDEDDNFFLDPAISIFKTVVMLTGEFDAGSIPFVTHPGVSHILFVLFVFLIAIVLFNLLNGLAVSDTQAIKADAELVGYVSRVKLVSYVETMALGDPTPYRGFIEKLRSICCCIPEIDCYSTQFKCLRMFSKKISLFTDLPTDCEIRVLPNQENKVEASAAGHNRKRQELDDGNNMKCMESCTAYYMCPNTVKTAKEIIAKKAEEEHNKLYKISDEGRDKLLLEYGKRLDKYKETLDSMSKSSEKMEEMMEQILKLLLKKDYQ